MTVHNQASTCISINASGLTSALPSLVRVSESDSHLGDVFTRIPVTFAILVSMTSDNCRASAPGDQRRTSNDYRHSEADLALVGVPGSGAGGLTCSW